MYSFKSRKYHCTEKRYTTVYYLRDLYTATWKVTGTYERNRSIDWKINCLFSRIYLRADRQPKTIILKQWYFWVGFKSKLLCTVIYLVCTKENNFFTLGYQRSDVQFKIRQLRRSKVIRSCLRTGQMTNFLLPRTNCSSFDSRNTINLRKTGR